MTFNQCNDIYIKHIDVTHEATQEQRTKRQRKRHRHSKQTIKTHFNAIANKNDDHHTKHEVMHHNNNKEIWTVKPSSRSSTSSTRRRHRDLKKTINNNNNTNKYDDNEHTNNELIHHNNCNEILTGTDELDIYGDHEANAVKSSTNITANSTSTYPQTIPNTSNDIKPTIAALMMQQKYVEKSCAKHHDEDDDDDDAKQIQYMLQNRLEDLPINIVYTIIGRMLEYFALCGCLDVMEISKLCWAQSNYGADPIVLLCELLENINDPDINTHCADFLADIDIYCLEPSASVRFACSADLMNVINSHYQLI